MIVVEGPDGAGKTSLVEKLIKDLEIPLAPKAVGGDAHALVPLRKYVDDTLDAGFRRMLYDRHALISEPIYSSGLTKMRPAKGFDDYRWVSTAYSRWRDLAPLVIICLPPFDEVWKNCQRDEHNKRLFPTKYRLAAIYWLYFNLAARNPAYMIYDYTKDQYGMVLDFLIHSLEMRQV